MKDTRKRPKRVAESSRSNGPRVGRGRKGSQLPRLWTRPKVQNCDAFGRLREEATDGYKVVEFWDWIRDCLEHLEANKGPNDDTDYLGMLPRALEWQRWFLIHALELNDLRDAYRFRTVLLLVARQNGKSTILTALILWRLHQDRAKMVLETHMSLDHAKAAWLEAVQIAEVIPDLANEIVTANTGKGSELYALDGGEKFKIASANRRGGRGYRGDLIIFDELREHQDWAAWSATSKTSLARRRAQVWGVSNAGGVDALVLRHVRKIALAAITGELPEGVPEEIIESVGDSIGLFEWSASPLENGQLRPIWDRDGWAEANPSMGFSELDEVAIANSLGDPEWEFRTEVLCQFIEASENSIFGPGAWEATLDLKRVRRERRVTRDTSRPAVYGIDMSHNRSRVYIALAFWDTEGRARVQLVAEGWGPDWVKRWLLSPDRIVPPTHIALQSKGAPVTSLLAELTRTKIDALGNVEEPALTVTPWQEQNVAAWHGLFFDAIRGAVSENPLVTLTHGAQPALDLAANTAVAKPLGDGWAIDRHKSPHDAAPLVAAIAAYGLLVSAPPAPFVSAYESNDLMVV